MRLAHPLCSCAALALLLRCNAFAQPARHLSDPPDTLRPATPACPQPPQYPQKTGAGGGLRNGGSEGGRGRRAYGSPRSAPPDGVINTTAAALEVSSKAPTSQRPSAVCGRALPTWSLAGQANRSKECTVYRGAACQQGVDPGITDRGQRSQAQGCARGGGIAGQAHGCYPVLCQPSRLFMN
jgi:hypothetical protein